MKKRITLCFDLGQICNDILVKCNLIGKSVKDEAAEDIKASILTPDDPETRSIINRAMTEAFGRVKTACQRYLTIGRTEDDNRLERLVKSVVYAKEPVEVRDKTEDGYELYSIKDLFTEDNGAYFSHYTNELAPEGVPTISIDDMYVIDTAPDLVVYQDDNDNWYLASNNEAITIPTGVEPTPKTHEELMDTDVITSMVYEQVTLVLHIDNFNLAVTDDLKSAIHKFVVHYILGSFLQDQHAEKAAEYQGLADGKDYKQIISDLNARDNYTMRKPSFM